MGGLFEEDTVIEFEDPKSTPQKEFDSVFWPKAWRKVSKGAALKAFLKARKSHELSVIMDGLERVTEDIQAGRRNEKLQPSTWLNAEGFLDEPMADAGPSAKLRKQRDEAAARIRAREEREAQESATLQRLCREWIKENYTDVEANRAAREVFEIKGIKLLPGVQATYRFTPTFVADHLRPGISQELWRNYVSER